MTEINLNMLKRINQTDIKMAMQVGIYECPTPRIACASWQTYQGFRLVLHIFTFETEGI